MMIIIHLLPSCLSYSIPFHPSVCTNNLHGWRHVILCWNQSVFFSTKQARRQRKTKRNNEQDFVFLDHIQLTLNIVSNGMEKMAYNNPLEKLLKYGQKHTWPTKYFHPIVYNAMCWDRMGWWNQTMLFLLLQSSSQPPAAASAFTIW